LILAAIVLFSVATFYHDCDFFQYTDAASGATMHADIWFYMRTYEGKCLNYPPGTVIDPSWMSARVFYYFWVGLGMLSALVNLPVTSRDRIVRVLGPGLMMTAICACLTFLVLNGDICRDNGGCDISTGAYLVIPAIGLCFLASIVSFVAYAEQKNEIERVQPDNSNRRFGQE